jgi:hypothetical protein
MKLPAFMSQKDVTLNAGWLYLGGLVLFVLGAIVGRAL